MKITPSIVFALVLSLVAANVAHGDEKEDIKAVKLAIETQVKLINEGKVDELKNHFTERQAKKLTAEMITKAKEEVAKYTIDELVASIAFGELDGKRTAKITMKDKCTLTTLVLTDGVWQADSLWFK